MSSDDKPANGMQVNIVFHMNAKIGEKRLNNQNNTVQYDTITFISTRW